MRNLRPLRHLTAVLCLVLLSGVAAPPARADGSPPLPAAHTEGDSFIDVVASVEHQLIKRADSIARPGTTQFVGKRSSGRRLVSRLFYSFDLAGIPADAITEVVLDNWQTYSPNRTCNLDSYGPPVEVVTTQPFTTRTPWPGPAVTDATPVSSGFAVGSRTSCIAQRAQYWDVTDMVRTAARSSSTVHLRLASADERKKAGYRKYDTVTGRNPVLRVFLRPHPDVPTDLAVREVAPNSPPTPFVTAQEYPTLTGHLSIPGGCARTSALTCLAVRWERSTPDGTVVAQGQDDNALDAAGAFVLRIGQLSEGVDHTVRVWGVNTDTGLESLEPATLPVRYDPRPAAPTVSSPGQWSLGEPVDVVVTTRDADAVQVCWEIATGTPDERLAGCAPIGPGEPTAVTLGTLRELASLDGSIWVVDRYGSQGSPFAFRGTVLW